MKKEKNGPPQDYDPMKKHRPQSRELGGEDTTTSNTSSKKTQLADLYKQRDDIKKALEDAHISSHVQYQEEFGTQPKAETNSQIENLEEDLKGTETKIEALETQLTKDNSKVKNILKIAGIALAILLIWQLLKQFG